MPRIIAGIAGGIRLDAPAGRQTRPTSDRVKEALFSIIAPELPGARVLDLFAGSGQFGIEAVSRGAVSADLVDNDHASLACIRTNIARSGLAGIHSIAGDVYRVLERMAAGGDLRFDLVFLDPPYRLAGQAIERAAALLGRGLLAPDAFVTDLQLVRNCKYGGTMLSFYKEIHDDRGSSF